MAPCPCSGPTSITHENNLLYRLHLKQAQHPFPAEYVGFHWAAGHHLMNPAKLPQRPQHHQTSILLHSRLLSIRVMIGVARQLWVQLRDSVILKRPCRIPRNAAVHKHADWRLIFVSSIWGLTDDWCDGPQPEREKVFAASDLLYEVHILLADPGTQAICLIPLFPSLYLLRFSQKVIKIDSFHKLSRSHTK